MILATGMSILGVAVVIGIITGIGFVVYRCSARLRRDLKAKRVNVHGSTATQKSDLAMEVISLQENVSYSSVSRQQRGSEIGDSDSDDYDDIIPTPCDHTYAELVPPTCSNIPPHCHDPTPKPTSD